ncbi:MAG: gliding motility lipoprotein GldH [Legionellales bacterium]|nr:gliding motility lipoprotein GldH [Legionellales bacterium]
MLNLKFTSRKSPLYLSLIGLIAGCVLGNERLQFSSFSNGWPQHEGVEFKFFPEKINSPTNLFLYLRNNDEYPFANIHLITTLENPIGEKLVDTLSYTMASPEGEWLGEGILIHESKLWYKEAYRFRVVGEHLLTVKPAMRHNGHAEPVNVLKGVTQVGLGIEQIQAD